MTAILYRYLSLFIPYSTSWMFSSIESSTIQSQSRGGEVTAFLGERIAIKKQKAKKGNHLKLELYLYL